ncbi:hypothetical protein BCR36DRAFT_583572 [Piromyces finnis]|uniref:Uncharacterized protein n=1 Tax=Piromyces finnis TaxID=1754191 RepID=A0A1Y1V9B8_9FUNG|nr:hypothetical protein BCR36DRAFT_583572 [Piromyces finnis]|eukprot:ORX49959.1 hypothetical protein BCR36DRAFT_583572 [Piromyces finnis]
MSKSYVRAKSQGFKQNSNNNNNGNSNNKKMKNNKAFNRKSIQKKYYNNPSNTSTFKTQKKKLCSASMKKMVHFNEIVEVGYTHAAEEYDRTSIVASKLTKEDILEILHLREKFRMETMEATRQRAIEESNQSSPVFTNVMPSSPIMDDMNLAVYASTSIGNSSLLTEVLAVPPSIISSPVLTPRTNDDEMITQKQREIEYMIYQKQQMENNYLEALHYQQALQVLAQQQQNFDLWRLYSQPQQTFIESDLYLQPSNSNYYANINNVSPSMALWYAQDKAMYPAEYEPVQLMTQMEVM